MVCERWASHTEASLLPGWSYLGTQLDPRRVKDMYEGLNGGIVQEVKVMLRSGVCVYVCVCRWLCVCVKSQ